MSAVWIKEIPRKKPPLKDSSFLPEWNMEEEWRLRCHFLVGGGQQEVKRSRRPCLGCKRRTTCGQFPDLCVAKDLHKHACRHFSGPSTPVDTWLHPEILIHGRFFNRRRRRMQPRYKKERWRRSITRSRRITRPASIPRAPCSAVCGAEEYLGQASCPGFAAIRSRAVISTQVTCYTFYKCKCTTTRITTNKWSTTSAAKKQNNNSALLHQMPVFGFGCIFWSI